MKTSRLSTLGLLLAATVAPAMQKPAGPKPAAPVAATPAAGKAAVPPAPAAGKPAASAAPAPAKNVVPAAAAKAAPAAPAPAKPVPVPAKAVATPVAAKPTPAPVPAATATPAPAAPAAPTGGDLVQSILEQDLEPPRNGFVYNPAGRRDPFISLSKPVASEEDTTRPRRPGIEGFMLQETSLKGVVKTADGWIAVLEGPDRKGYFVRVGQRLHDGVLTAIDAAGLTFRQEITDPLSPAKSREVRRLLHSAQEESDK